MLREKYTNAIATSLDGAINSSVTTVDVDDASTFPDAGFSIVVESEIMYVTSRASNTLTVLRAQEGTSASSHADNVPVNHIITKGSLDRFRLGILADIGLVPYEDSLSADDDEFDDESFSGWTAVAGSPSLVTTIERNHRFDVVVPTGTASAQYYAWMKAKAPSAGDWIQAAFQFSGSGHQFPIPAIIMADGATYNAGNQVMLGWSPQESKFIVRSMTGYKTSVLSTNYGDRVHDYPLVAIHLRLVWNSSNNYSLYHSHDGIIWAELQTGISIGSVGTPTHMGFGFTSWAAVREVNCSILYCRFSF